MTFLLPERNLAVALCSCSGTSEDHLAASLIYALLGQPVTSGGYLTLTHRSAGVPHTFQFQEMQ